MKAACSRAQRHYHLRLLKSLCLECMQLKLARIEIPILHLHRTAGLRAHVEHFDLELG